MPIDQVALDVPAEQRQAVSSHAKSRANRRTAGEIVSDTAWRSIVTHACAFALEPFSVSGCGEPTCVAAPSSITLALSLSFRIEKQLRRSRRPSIWICCTRRASRASRGTSEIVQVGVPVLRSGSCARQLADRRQAAPVKALQQRRELRGARRGEAAVRFAFTLVRARVAADLRVFAIWLRDAAVEGLSGLHNPARRKRSAAP